MRLLAILTLAAVAGCAARDAPYKFRGELVGGVRAAAPPPNRVRATRKPAEVAVAVSRERERQRPIASKASKTDKTSPSPAEAGPTPLTLTLRALVGERDANGTDVDFAVRALLVLGIESEHLRAVQTGKDLLSLARDGGGSATSAPALLGDIVVFNEVVGSRDASLVGVAVGTREDHTIEFVYLARGVVRRGYVNPLEPSLQRNASGRILNTFVRHSDGGDSRGTRYLSGQLYAGVLRLDDLL